MKVEKKKLLCYNLGRWYHTARLVPGAWLFASYAIAARFRTAFYHWRFTPQEVSNGHMRKASNNL